MTHEEFMVGTSRGIPEVTEEEKQAARLTVCRVAGNVEDAARLMDILGILPNQPDAMGVERRKLEKRLQRKRLIKSIERKRKQGAPLSDEEEEFLEENPRLSA